MWFLDDLDEMANLIPQQRLSIQAAAKSPVALNPNSLTSLIVFEDFLPLIVATQNRMSTSLECTLGFLAIMTGA